MSQIEFTNEDQFKAPFDLAAPPQTLIVADSPGQHLALQAVTCAQDSDSDEHARFAAQRQYTKPLEYFQGLYEHRQHQLATSLLSKRIKVNFNSPLYTTQADDETLSWAINE